MSLNLLELNALKFPDFLDFSLGAGVLWQTSFLYFFAEKITKIPSKYQPGKSTCSCKNLENACQIRLLSQRL